MAFAIHLTVASPDTGIATANAARLLFNANHAVVDHSLPSPARLIRFMTHHRTLTVAHWGVYEVEYDEAGKAVDLHPFSRDPDPSPIGLHMLSDEVARLRVRRPAVRKSWLDHGPGAFPERRGGEPFVEVPWDEALDLVAGELGR